MGAFGLAGGQPAALVRDLEPDGLGLEHQPHPCARAHGMPMDVGQALLDDAEQRGLGLGRQAADVGGHVELDLDAAALGEALDVAAERARQAHLVQQRRVEQVRERAQLA